MPVAPPAARTVAAQRVFRVPHTISAIVPAPANPTALDGEGPPSRALLALALIAPAPSVGVVAAMIAWPGTFGTVVFMLAKAWMLLLPVVWRRLVERQPLSLSPARRGGFGVGIVLGIVISILVVAAYWVVGRHWIDDDHVREMAQQNGIGTPARYLAAVAYWVLVNSVLEEYVYRWFIFRQCERLMPGAAAVLASATLFTVHHVIALRVQFGWNVTILASLGTFIGGAVWSWLYLRYRSVWPAYVSHAIVDVAIFVVGWRILFA
jgi:membrane protease YdiL (CAAX protease family)